VAESVALEPVKLALDLGSDINAANAEGETALHGAAATRMDSIVRFLIAHGAQINARTKKRETPLIYAERTLQFAGKDVMEKTATGDLIRSLGGST
jgi:ankyrin repeat protein